MQEFEFIQRCCLQLGAVDPAVTVGVGDDAAVTELPPGHALLVSTDTMNVHQHFYPDAKPHDLAHKLLHANVSDIAAMGGQARWTTVALSLEQMDSTWLEAFADGLHVSAQQLGVAVIGGDTTKGPLSMTLTVMGTIEQGKALLRKGAQVGDLICVTGCLGGAAAGLQLVQAQRTNTLVPVALRALDRIACKALLACLARPVAQDVIGRSLVGFANSCIDVSDGLAGDLQHILRASQVHAQINWDDIPVHPALLNVDESERGLLKEWVLYGGEDYQLVFTIGPDNYTAWQAQCPSLTSEVSVIGNVTAPQDDNSTKDESRLRLLEAGTTLVLDPYAFQHF